MEHNRSLRIDLPSPRRRHPRRRHWPVYFPTHSPEILPRSPLALDNYAPRLFTAYLGIIRHVRSRDHIPNKTHARPRPNPHHNLPFPFHSQPNPLFPRVPNVSSLPLSFSPNHHPTRALSLHTRFHVLSLHALAPMLYTSTIQACLPRTHDCHWSG